MDPRTLTEKFTFWGAILLIYFQISTLKSIPGHTLWQWIELLHQIRGSTERFGRNITISECSQLFFFLPFPPHTLIFQLNVYSEAQNSTADRSTAPNQFQLDVFATNVHFGCFLEFSTLLTSYADIWPWILVTGQKKKWTADRSAASIQFQLAVLAKNLHFFLWGGGNFELGKRGVWGGSFLTAIAPFKAVSIYPGLMLEIDPPSNFVPGYENSG